MIESDSKDVQSFMDIETKISKIEGKLDAILAFVYLGSLWDNQSALKTIAIEAEWSSPDEQGLWPDTITPILVRDLKLIHRDFRFQSRLLNLC